MYDCICVYPLSTICLLYINPFRSKIDLAITRKKKCNILGQDRELYTLFELGAWPGACLGVPLGSTSRNTLGEYLPGVPPGVLLGSTSRSTLGEYLPEYSWGQSVLPPEHAPEHAPKHAPEHLSNTSSTKRLWMQNLLREVLPKGTPQWYCPGAPGHLPKRLLADGWWKEWILRK